MSDKQLEIPIQKQLVKYAEDLVRLYQEVKKENTLLIEANRQLEESYVATVIMGFDLIKLYDEFLASHCKRVAYYSERIAKNLQLESSAITEIKLAALLHDIGLIGIPRQELLKMTAGKSKNVQKNDIYLQHPVAQIRPITSSPRFEEIAKIISAHHEYLDGSGFPKGLRGETIPFASRIITVANEYDAIKKISKTETPPEKFLPQMQEHIGERYDVEVFRAFSEIFQEGDPLSQTIEVSVKELQSGMVLAKALLTVEETIVLGSDSVLDKNHIDHIARFHNNNRLQSSAVTVYKSAS